VVGFHNSKRPANLTIFCERITSSGMIQPVRHRAIFFIGGYEQKAPRAFFGRLTKQLSYFDSLWGYTSEVSAVEVSADEEIGTIIISTSSAQEAWSTETEFSFLSLNKLVLADFARPMTVRLVRYLGSFADFVFSGTAVRFFAHAWRFGLYFVYPFLVLALFLLLGCCVTLLTWPLLGPAGTAPGVLVFCLALCRLGKQWSTNHLMDLWSFSGAFIRDQRGDAEDLLQRYAETVVRKVKNGNYDEILLIGHSTGGMLMIDVLARCLAIDPDFARSARNVVLLTLGSTALKAGYHPAGRSFKTAVERLIDSDELKWVEIQCLTDAINFYKTDPVKAMGLASKGSKTFPLVRSVKVRDMLKPETYLKVRKNLFRVHYQYVYANTKPYWYDFFQICCGPMPIYERVEKRVVGPLPTEVELA